MFDLRALKYFIAAYEEGSVTAAARRCFISQPSVTHAIQTLEQTLSAKLFSRTRTGLVATDDGHRLYPLATRLLAEAAAVTQAFGQPVQELRLHLQADVHMQQVAAVARAIQQSRPQAQLRLIHDEAGADLRLVSVQGVRHDEWAQTLWDDEYVAAVPRAHPLSSRAELSIRDLDGVDFVDRPQCLMHQSFKQLLARDNVKPVIRAIADREEAVATLVGVGVGLAILPRSHVTGASDIVVLPVSGEGLKNVRRVCLCCVRSNQAMVDLAREIALNVTNPPGTSRPALARHG